MNSKLIYFIINYLYFIHLSYEVEPYLLFPFKKINLNPNNINDKSLDISSEILNILISNNIYIPLKIGSSNITINSFLSFSQSFLTIGPENCLIDNGDNYIMGNSTSFNLISNITLGNIEKRQYEKAIHFQEKVIYINNTKEITINNMNCFSYINNNIIKCSIFGLDLSKDKTQQNLFKVILEKNKMNIKKSYLSIIFNNNSNIFNKDNQQNNINEGEILLGVPPHEYYMKSFFKKELVEINTQCSRDYLSWILKFDSVYVENKNASTKYFKFTKIYYYDYEYYYGVFYPEINTIYVPNDIFNYYINNYFNKYLNRECIKRGRPLYNKYVTNGVFTRTHIFVYCNKSKIKDLSEFYDEFPTLNLKNTFLKETFFIQGKELFIEDDNYIYFILLPEFTKNNKFLLGKMFMTKYQFTFNYDTKTIGYYNKNLSKIISKKNETKNKFKKKDFSNYKIEYIIIIIILFFILFGLGIIYIVKCLNKNDKNENQALELSYVKKEE